MHTQTHLRSNTYDRMERTASAATVISAAKLSPRANEVLTLSSELEESIVVKLLVLYKNKEGMLIVVGNASVSFSVGNFSIGVGVLLMIVLLGRSNVSPIDLVKEGTGVSLIVRLSITLMVVGEGKGVSLIVRLSITLMVVGEGTGVSLIVRLGITLIVVGEGTGVSLIVRLTITLLVVREGTGFSLIVRLAITLMVVGEGTGVALIVRLSITLMVVGKGTGFSLIV